MRFTAFDANGAVLHRAEYFSLGGGAVEGEGFENLDRAEDVPYPFASAQELLALGDAAGLAIWQVVRANELALQPEAALERELSAIWQAMDASAERGLHTEGILPGGLEVRRRAPRLYAKYLARAANQSLDALDYLNVVAIAVNEENAAGGRVVTAPTNGAAGIIPAVLRYYRDFDAGRGRGRHRAVPAHRGGDRHALQAQRLDLRRRGRLPGRGRRRLLDGGGGLVAALNGTNAQVENAAEIGMEHNLGLTCDPVGGLVQIPCIERNAMGAVKAINAARMAMRGDGSTRSRSTRSSRPCARPARTCSPSTRKPRSAASRSTSWSAEARERLRRGLRRRGENAAEMSVATAKELLVGGVPLTYHESGSGAPILVLHGETETCRPKRRFSPAWRNSGA